MPSPPILVNLSQLTQQKIGWYLSRNQLREVHRQIKQYPKNAVLSVIQQLLDICSDERVDPELSWEWVGVGLKLHDLAKQFDIYDQVKLIWIRFSQRSKKKFPQSAEKIWNRWNTYRPPPSKYPLRFMFEIAAFDFIVTNKKLYNSHSSSLFSDECPLPLQSLQRKVRWLSHLPTYQPMIW